MKVKILILLICLSQISLVRVLMKIDSKDLLKHALRILSTNPDSVELQKCSDNLTQNQLIALSDAFSPLSTTNISQILDGIRTLVDRDDPESKTCGQVFQTELSPNYQDESRINPIKVLIEPKQDKTTEIITSFRDILPINKQGVVLKELNGKNK
jgi:hypothetical protein